MSRTLTLRMRCDVCQGEEEISLPVAGGRMDQPPLHQYPWRRFNGWDVCGPCTEAFQKWRRAEGKMAITEWVLTRS